MATVKVLGALLLVLSFSVSVFAQDTFETKQLKEGNNYFIKNSNNSAVVDVKRVKNLATNGQQQFAVIVTCSDSGFSKTYF